MKALSRPGHSYSKCWVVENWTGFSPVVYDPALWVTFQSVTVRGVNRSSDAPCRRCAFIDVQWSQTGCSPWPQRSLRGEGQSLAYRCFLPASQQPPSAARNTAPTSTLTPDGALQPGWPAGQSSPGPDLQRIQVCVVWVETREALCVCVCVCNKTSMHIFVSLYEFAVTWELSFSQDQIFFSHPALAVLSLSSGRHLNYNQFGKVEIWTQEAGQCQEGF